MASQSSQKRRDQRLLFVFGINIRDRKSYYVSRSQDWSVLKERFLKIIKKSYCQKQCVFLVKLNGSSGKAICKLERKLGFVWQHSRSRHFFFVADLSKLGHLRSAQRVLCNGFLVVN